jgi:hypothetical protein
MGRQPEPSPLSFASELIVRDDLLKDAPRHESGLAHVLPAWIISGATHVLLICLFLLTTFTPNATSNATEQVTIETSIVERPAEEVLTNPEEGLDPLLEKGFNLERIGPDSIPGFIDVSADQAGNMKGERDTHIVVPPPFGPPGGEGGSMFSTTPGNLDPKKMSGFGGPWPGTLNPSLRARIGSAETRMKTALEGGGSQGSELAVARALRWLALHQANDGHWSLDGFHRHAHEKPGLGGKPIMCTCDKRGGLSNDIAGTALGLLPFLGAGETHKPPTTPGDVHYTKQVEAGLRYLLSRQAADGNFGGGMYAHGLATIAVCEAYGLTSDGRLKDPAQRALDFIVRAQHAAGGWRYGPNEPGDTSVTGWQVMALKSGQMSGLSVSAAALTGAEKWLDSCMNNEGGYGYLDRQETPAMTAVGLLCRQYLGWSPRNPKLQSGVAKLRATPPGQLDSFYYHYYATQVMHHMGGDSWQTWNPKMRDLLIAAQDKGNAPNKAHQLGSWPPGKDVYDGVGGRLMVTSLATLTLEVYYRHLPLYRRDLGTAKMQP